MFGIVGWIDWQQDVSHRHSVTERMAKTLSKRGPDSLNVWSSKYISLGHTRLSVVDPDGGMQPMEKEKYGNSYQIVYNGELYNTEDIR